MELNLSTFVFEMINFLILIWILQHFLYKPVLEVIDQRRQAIEKSLSAAKNIRGEAEKLQIKYENRLTEWELEKKNAFNAMHLEIEQERTRLMEKLNKILEEEHKKAKVIGERHLMEDQRRNETLALKQGARFAGLLLKHAAGPELETRLFFSLLHNLSSLPVEQAQSLHSFKNLESVSIEIVSAYELNRDHCQKLEQSLNKIAGRSANYHYRQDPELIAGFRISIGPWVLKANLQDELVGFAEIANDSE